MSFTLSGDTLSTASGSMQASLLFGSEAYGSAKISGENGGSGYSFYMKASGDQSTNDPTNMKRQVAFTVTNVGKVLNKSAALWIMTTEKI